MSIFDQGAYSDDLAGWSFGGGGSNSFNTGADYYGGGDAQTSLSGWASANNALSGGIVGWAASNQDVVEQARMGQAYPANGQPYDWNAATLGVSRLIDTALKGYTVVKGAQAATYAGQNGLTYTNGTGRTVAVGGGGLLPLLLIAGVVYMLATG